MFWISTIIICLGTQTTEKRGLTSGFACQVRWSCYWCCYCRCCSSRPWEPPLVNTGAALVTIHWVILVLLFCYCYCYCQCVVLQLLLLLLLSLITHHPWENWRRPGNNPLGNWSVITKASTDRISDHHLPSNHVFVIFTISIKLPPIHHSIHTITRKRNSWESTGVIIRFQNSRHGVIPCVHVLESMILSPISPF